MDVRVDQVEADGHLMQYRTAGLGPPVLLLHGGWSDSREWWPQLSDLSDEFTCVAVDLPGNGGSWDPPDDIGLAGIADLLAAFVDALNLDPPHVVGLSFGGGVALALCHRHPAIPKSLVLASAYAGWAGSLPADVVAARVRRVLDEADRPPEEWISTYLPGFFAGPVPPEVVDRLLEIMRDVRPAGIRAMVNAFAAADLRETLTDIAVPTLVIHGEHDERAPRPVADDLHRRIPDSTLLVLAGVGHVVNVEAADEFNREVRSFLRRVDS